MALRLNTDFYKRNREREEEYGGFFSQASTRLKFVMNILIPALLTPAVIATSLFSKDVMLIVANLFLSLGYVVNFGHRLYKREMGVAELLVTLAGIAAAIAIAFYLSPAVVVWSLVNIFTVVNEVALAINSFFVVRNLIVPPIKRLIEHIGEKCGFKIRAAYFSRPRLKLSKDGQANDSHVIDKLFAKFYPNQDVSKKLTEAKLKPINKLLKKLSAYINKYNETLLGSVSREEEISQLEASIKKLTVDGDSDSSLGFIKKKLSFKRTKIKLLEEARDTLETAKEDREKNKDEHMDISHCFKFFKGYSRSMSQKVSEKFIEQGQECLRLEIERQQEKIDSLNECLP